jgi:putative ABC transport system permease protein
MQSLLNDLRYGARTLLKKPGFTVVAVLTLALGIGANTAIFSVINAVLLRPLPFREPGRIVSVANVDLKEGGDPFVSSWPDFNDWRAQNQSFEKLAAFNPRDLNLAGAGEPLRLRGAMVTSELFPLLGASPQLGRGFTAEEDRPGAHAVILGQDFWRRHFNADPRAVGRTLDINGLSYEVVGVMPAGFEFPYSAEPVELWVNAGIDGEGRAPLMAQRGNHNLSVVGRLKPGVPLAQAQSEMARIAEDLAKQYPDTNTGFGARVTPYLESLVGDLRFALLLLLGAVGCVLLIACANVANLLLARGAARQREVAVRAALGASRWRVVRQLLTESVLLAACGGAAGLLLARWGTDSLMAFVPQSLPRAARPEVDAGVFGFTLLVSLLTGVLFGLMPAWQAAKVDLTEALKEGGRSGDGARGKRLRGALIVAQVAVALVLLVCAGLLVNSFWRLQRVEPGFDPHNVLTFSVSLQGARYDQPQARENFYQQLLARVSALPGVTSASASTVIPLSGSNSDAGFAVEGVPTDPAQPYPNITYLRVVRPDYFRTMNIPLREGRDFDEHDTLRSAPVVIVNETLARKYFPNQNPLGRHINPAFGVDERGILWREIVGVVGDVRHASLREESGPEAYVVQAQAPWRTTNVVARTSGDPRALIPAVRREVGALDPTLPVYAAKPLEDYLATSLARPRFGAVLLAVFAVVALALTLLGLYGVMSYTVAQRTREIGVRIALGARPRDVMRLVIRQGAILTLLGIVIGAAAAFAATRLIKSFLFEVSADDGLTFAVIAGLLAAVALLACYVPARRATKVDPMVALRYE